ncbi:glycosyltransferase, group 1 family protein [Clostridiales bacterium oral taxon 876 str. F0540]|nr:glycosyltransferase, group 1 family protein [Clostridiales bacterium oral taxon 876 str. F0540]
MMKILITTDTYFPMINGVVTSTNNLYKELKAKGHEVKILTLSHRSEEWSEGDIYYLKSVKAGIYPDARIKVPFYNKLVKEILDWKPDIVHSQTEFSTMIAAKHIARKLNIPHIHTYHTLYEDYLKYILNGRVIKKGAAAMFTKLLLNSLDGVVAPTDKTKEVLEGYGVNTYMHVVPTGIDLRKFQREISKEEKEELYRKLNLKKEDKIIAYVGRIAEEKNISEIISLFPSVLEKAENTKLLIVGGGPYIDELRQQVDNMKLEGKVIFAGMVKPEEVYKYYKLAHIFVTASTSETQGLTYLEALSTGCPIVCKYDKCIEGVVLQGINGYSYKTEVQFSDYISRILLNDSLRLSMSEAAQAKADEYSSSTFASNILEAYNKTIEYSEFINVQVGA